MFVIIILIVLVAILNYNSVDTRKHRKPVKYILEFNENDRMIVDKKTYTRAMSSWECMKPGPIDVTHLKNPMKINYSLERSLSHLYRAAWTITNTDTVKSMIPFINKVRMKSTLSDLMAFQNRHAFNPTAKEATSYLQKKVESIFTNVSHVKCSVQLFPHTFTENGMTPNSSVIARIEGHTTPQEIIILCSHMDSINHSMVDPSAKRTARAPGGDDNGTGTICNLEVLSSWIESKKVPVRTIEFHWYAGEELGLKGSLEVAQKYRNDNKRVIAVCNSDMTGYPNAANNMYIIADKAEADPDLAEFMSQLMKTHTKSNPVKGKCGYGCSDHTSWFKFGYPAVAISEGLPSVAKSMTPYIHTSTDNDSVLNYDVMVNFAICMLAFSVETAGIVKTMRRKRT